MSPKVSVLIVGTQQKQKRGTKVMFKKNLIFVIAVSVFSSYAQAELTCEHTIVHDWGTGFTGAVKIHNTGNKSVLWEVRWEYLSRSKITDTWNASVTRDSEQYIGKGMSWNDKIKPDHTNEVGLSGSGPGKGATILYCGKVQKP